MRVQSPGWEDPLEEEMATHSSIFAQRIPWPEKPGRQQSMGSPSWTELKWLSVCVFPLNADNNSWCRHEYYPRFTVGGTEFSVVNQMVLGHRVKWYGWTTQPSFPDLQCWTPNNRLWGSHSAGVSLPRPEPQACSACPAPPAPTQSCRLLTWALSPLSATHSPAHTKTQLWPHGCPHSSRFPLWALHKYSRSANDASNEQTHRKEDLWSHEGAWISTEMDTCNWKYTIVQYAFFSLFFDRKMCHRIMWCFSTEFDTLDFYIHITQLYC